MTKTTPSNKEQYIAMNQRNNFEPNVDVNTLSEKFMKAHLDYDAWYESKDGGYQLFIDTIAERTNFIIDEADYDAFIEELANYGINDVNDFDETFLEEYEGCGEEKLSELIENNAQKEEWETLSELNEDNVVDVEFKGNTYFFQTD